MKQTQQVFVSPSNSLFVKVNQLPSETYKNNPSESSKSFKRNSPLQSPHKEYFPCNQVYSKLPQKIPTLCDSDLFVWWIQVRRTSKLLTSNKWVRQLEGCAVGTHQDRWGSKPQHQAYRCRISGKSCPLRLAHARLVGLWWSGKNGKTATACFLMVVSIITWRPLGNVWDAISRGIYTNGIGWGRTGVVNSLAFIIGPFRKEAVGNID